MKRLPAPFLVVSAIGIAAFVGYEGYSPRAYDDGVGVQTIGFGSTRHIDGTPVKAGDTVTPQRAVVMLAKDADRIWREAARCIGEVPLYQHEADAYASLAYNIGAAAFCRSTIVKKLKQNPPDYAGACEAIRMWNRAGGQVLPGLTKRREAEYRMCKGEAP
jgi:lysozyme